MMYQSLHCLDQHQPQRQANVLYIYTYKMHIMHMIHLIHIIQQLRLSLISIACTYICTHTHTHTHTHTPGFSEQTRSSHPWTGFPYGHRGRCLRPQRGQPSAFKSKQFQTPGRTLQAHVRCVQVQMTYQYGKRDLPTMAKETYLQSMTYLQCKEGGQALYGKRDLLIWQKRPTYNGKEGGQALLGFRVVGAFLEKKVRKDFEVLGRNLYTHAYTHTNAHIRTHKRTW
jgi:hypothetical protein